MLSAFAEGMFVDSPTASVVVSIAAMLLGGFAMTRLTKLCRLPNVTAYILTGILLGPYCLHLVPASVVEGMDFLSDVALSFVAFSIGEFFRLDVLRKNGGKVAVVAVFESILASAVVFVVLYFVLRLHLAFCIVVAALAAVTAPTSTAVTIKQTGAKGEFVNILLQTIALDDIIGLVGYSIAISVSMSFLAPGRDVAFSDVLFPLFANLGALVLGGVFGLLMKWLMPGKRSTDNRLIISVSLLSAFCGVCALLDISPLLGCMSMGTVYINTTGDGKLFKQLGYFSPPLLLLFFVRSGLQFDLAALFSTAGAVGSVSLFVVGILYFFLRMAGKYAGAFLGCLVTGMPAKTRSFLGLGLIPQAGVAIGLAALGARALDGEVGNALHTVILAAGVLYELVGPALAKLGLYLSGAYTPALEELIPAEEVAQGEHLSETELLIRRIRKIQQTLPPPMEEEQAFTEAAEEQLEAYRYHQRLFFYRHRR